MRLLFVSALLIHTSALFADNSSPPASRRQTTSKSWDKDKDGRPDKWARFRGEEVVEVSYDTNGDGKPDKWEFFNKGFIYRLDEDTNLDGKADMRTNYINGYPSSRKYDDNHDEVFDRLLIFDGSEKLTLDSTDLSTMFKKKPSGSENGVSLPTLKRQGSPKKQKKKLNVRKIGPTTAAPPNTFVLALDAMGLQTRAPGKDDGNWIVLEEDSPDKSLSLVEKSSGGTVQFKTYVDEFVRDTDLPATLSTISKNASKGRFFNVQTEGPSRSVIGSGYRRRVRILDSKHPETIDLYLFRDGKRLYLVQAVCRSPSCSWQEFGKAAETIARWIGPNGAGE